MYNKTKVYYTTDAYPLVYDYEIENIVFKNSNDIIQEMKNKVINEMRNIIKSEIYKEDFYGYSDKQKLNGNTYILLLNDNKLCIIYGKSNRKETDIFKYVYEYNQVDNNPYVLNITSLNKFESYFLLSESTKIDNYSCSNFDDLPHNFNDKICENDLKFDNILNISTLIYIDSFVTDSSFSISLSRYIYGLSTFYFSRRKLTEINYKINSTLETQSISYYTFGKYNNKTFTFKGMTSNYIYSISNSSSTNCTISYDIINEISHEKLYTYLNVSNNSSKSLYCFNLTNDLYHIYCLKSTKDDNLHALIMNLYNTEPFHILRILY